MIILDEKDIFNKNIKNYLKEVQNKDATIVINCNENTNLILINLKKYTTLKMAQLEKLLIKLETHKTK